MVRNPHLQQHDDDELPSDVQWAIGTVADLHLEIKAMRESAQRRCDGYALQVVQRVYDHAFALQRLLQTLQAHVGLPKPPRLPIWDQPTTILQPPPQSQGDVPVDND
ncbi:MAG TPA: hypothetical protein VKQ36_02645 [Ktedonobacterales bacterium]|nr:hypothetical protein [Ktedonobacterales bacterium]